MSVPTAINGRLTARGVIQAALEDIGVLIAGQNASEEDEAIGVRTLNYMLKEWQSDGANLWRTTSGLVAVLAGQSTFIPLDEDGNRLFDVTSVAVVTSYERSLSRWERGEFSDLPNKNTPGPPTIYVPMPGLDALEVRLWPVPASDMSISYEGVRVAADVTSANDNLDMDQSWTSCIVANLAARLADPFQIQPAPVTVIRRAAQLYQQLRAADRPASYILESAGASSWR